MALEQGIRNLTFGFLGVWPTLLAQGFGVGLAQLCRSYLGFGFLGLHTAFALLLKVVNPWRV